MSEYQKWYADNHHLITENAHNHVVKIERQLAALRAHSRATGEREMSELMCSQSKCRRKDEHIAELEQRIHDAYEVYAGMDGVMPESDKEVYLMRCITQMARELEKGE